MFGSSEIADILSLTPEGPARPDRIVQKIRIDSRKVLRSEDCLFVALKGERTDGHLFVQDAYDRGARMFLVQNGIDIELPDDAVLYRVDNVIAALQALARAHRAKFNIPVIGITGSNGKTWVKEWLYFLLSDSLQVVRSPRSYNSQLGVPLSVLQMKQTHELAIIEAGISQDGEMHRLRDVVAPAIGVFTNLGDAHSAGFASLDQKLREKCRLFENSEVIIYPGDYQKIATYIGQTFKDKQLVSWGYAEECSLRVLEYQRGHHSYVRYRWGNDEYRIAIPYPDQASWHNAMTCCAVLHQLGLANSASLARFEHLPPVKMRLELHRLPQGGILIDDTYSLDLASLQAGLDSLNEYGAGMEKALIITEIDQQQDDIYPRLAEVINTGHVDRVYTIGDNSRSIIQLLKESIASQSFATIEEFMDSRVWEVSHNTAYLLKGARRFELDRLVAVMKRLSHTASLQIDLNALLHNVKQFAGRLGQGTSIFAMVKAAAYGSGGAEVARFMEYHNIQMLGVAYADEGVELRRAGIDLPILVMNPDYGSVHNMLKHNLEPEVYDVALFDFLSEASSRMGTRIKVHLKIDTGMHRLGFNSDELDPLLRRLEAPSNVEVASVFTHLAAAGDPHQEAFTRGQVERFNQAYERIVAATGNKPMRHVLNSAGVLYYPEYEFEAVRLGVGLYGVGVPGGILDLKPVHQFEAQVSQLRELKAGDTVGYDRSFEAQENMLMATVNVGYADGLPRRCGNGRYHLMIRGVLVPIIGNVCMDMCMVDVSKVPDVRVGDQAIVFGPRHEIERLAQVCETIPYEILTGISQRIPRIFNFGW